MACFLVSAAEAVVVTAIEKAEEKKELKMAETETEITEEVTIPWSRKLKWLTYMLWGGAVLLAFEHIWHGEVVPDGRCSYGRSDYGGLDSHVYCGERNSETSVKSIHAENCNMRR